jgi:phospholipid/cholesterol/gamma-HCH transport system ATP-binding protein
MADQPGEGQRDKPWDPWADARPTRETTRPQAQRDEGQARPDEAPQAQQDEGQARPDEAPQPRRQDGNGQLETEIGIKDLTKTFGSQTVFEDVTCDIPKGKITVILGPSGTGKSVFLKHVMGLLRPDRGEIWIDNKNIPDLSEKELYAVRRKFGVLFQDGALFGSMSVYDNVAFPLREHTKTGEKEIKDIVMEKLEMVGLKGAEEKLPGEISGGMKKRAGLARALVLDPEIVMFDEPDSGLDPVRTAYLSELIRDLNSQIGFSCVVVTHDIATCRRVSDYIGMLCRRHLIQFGPANEMFESDVPEVRQFLAGDTKGPIGMAEEKDEDISAESTSGKSYEETEEMERASGAPDGRTPPPAPTDEDWKQAEARRSEAAAAGGSSRPAADQGEGGIFEGWGQDRDPKEGSR